MFNRTKEPRVAAGRVARVLVFAALAFSAAVANANIAATRHNLGADNAVNDTFMTGGTTEICVFCHTPHGSNTNVQAPLWNKPVNSGTYTTYSSATSGTLDGSVSMAGVSLACLSCHDGVTAMNTVINAPGSGGHSLAGSAMAGTWTGARQTAGVMTNGGGFISNLSTDLSNDHPVGIQYCGGGISTGSASTTGASAGTCRDPDFTTPSNSLIGGNRVWWVNTTATGSTTGREKTDMILYARAPTTMTGDSTNGFHQPFVECGSCHDPHSSNATFLRIPNAQSAVCLACHTK